MSTGPLKIVHLTLTVGKESTGLGAVSLDLAKSHSRLGYDVKLWTMDGPAELRWASESSGLAAERLRGFPRTRLVIPPVSVGMEREAAAPDQRGISVVHQHGLWTGTSRVTRIFRRIHRTPTVVGPHGSLHGLALQKSRWKKQLALALYERNNLRDCSCLQAVSEGEIASIRDFGLRNPIAVIPNGISTEWIENRGDGAQFRDQFGIPREKRVLLFLSRISPIKGLTMLLEAVGAMGDDFANWQLVLAGGDEFGHRMELERIICERGLTRSVSFTGPIFDEVKRNAYAAADLFVLPSFSEGAPVVILEALAAGVPVLATKASPWQDLETHGCGWWTEINAGALGEALGKAAHVPPEALREMGRKGRDLVSSQYGWDAPARRAIELYDWLRGETGRPGFVVLD